MFDLPEDGNQARDLLSINWLSLLQFGPVVSTVTKSLLLILLVIFLYRLTSRAIETLARRNRVPETLAVFLRRLSRGLAIAIVLILILEAFGVLRDAWVIFSAVLATVAVGFVATWSILSNMFCWIVVVVSQPFYIGQTIELVGDNVRGRVRDINLMYTVLEESDGSVVMIPNNLLVQKSIRRVMKAAADAIEAPPVA